MINHLFNWLLPNICSMCGLVADEYNLCVKCRQDLPINLPCCPQCAVKANNVCGKCLSHKPLWQQATVPFVYVDSIKDLIRQFKFHHQPYLAKTLAHYFIEQLLINRADILPDIIIPVPLHKRRLSSRKYNQSHLLAKHIAKKLDIAMLLNVASRHKNTASQALLNKKQRQNNMQSAFTIRNGDKITGKYLAIVDDVYTTGATLQSLSRELHKFKPQRIDVWCIARSSNL